MPLDLYQGVILLRSSIAKEPDSSLRQAADRPEQGSNTTKNCFLPGAQHLLCWLGMSKANLEQQSYRWLEQAKNGLLTLQRL